MKPLIPATTQEAEAIQEGSNQQSSPDDDEDKPICDWGFKLSAVISSSNVSANISDAIGAIEFDHEDRLLATGGIARKIRIYRFEKLVNYVGRGDRALLHDSTAMCEFYMCTPAKLSSLKWKPGSGSRVLGSGDYDGVVMEYDLEKRVPVFERDEHGGRRVWSMDYSRSDPNLGASGSDDGSVQMWDPRCDGGKCLATVVPNPITRCPVCCVEFDPFGGPIAAAGCADRIIYGYDLRKLSNPIFTLDGHRNAVTYAKFLDSRTIVSSAIDGCLMMWNVESQRVIRTYRGHVNSRRFVGLSVWGNGGGLLSCGSENNRVFVYDTRWGRPIWAGGFEQEDGRGFVSGVCWRRGTGEEQCMLVAGGSDGALQVYEGIKKAGLDN